MTVTIKDIAKASGVSYSTVSKALNNNPLVKSETKVKILKVAKELDYRPNSSARNLVSKRSYAIGVVWPTIERVALSALITKLNHLIEKKSYSMILSISEIHSSVEMFRSFPVDGIIVFEEDEKTLFDTGVLKTIPVLSYGVSKEKPYPIVDVNHKKAINLAVDHLSHLGHKHISYIGDLSSIDPRQKEKVLGFKESMKNLQFPIEDFSIIDTQGLDWYDGYLATTSFLENNTSATAVIGGSYDITVGILKRIREENMQIPKDISIIGYDNIPQMGSLEIPITSVGVPMEKLAEQIVNTLLYFIENPECEKPLVQSLTPELNDRKSCKISN